ncbi:hypothetical protein DFJ74DRAFT_665041 [Hyaloraphidium curvatum]|nr:hypothetical protein DFJ74DRAFT_665041 [Hyaloraphidium curvatum]
MVRLGRYAQQLLFGIACVAAGHWSARGLVAAPWSSPVAGAASQDLSASAAPRVRFLPPDVFFVFYAPPYGETCGGCTSVHVLVDQLNRLYGSVQAPAAYLVPRAEDRRRNRTLETNPAYATPLLPPWMNASEGVAVYTDTTRGNPLRARRAVRWVLYFPGGIWGAPKASEYPNEDLIACYMPAFCSEFAGRPTLTLFVVDIYLDYYRNLPRPPGGRRNGTLWFSRKNTYAVNGTLLTRPPPDLSGKDVLDPETKKRERLERFAVSELFVSYDPATYRTVEAVLTGCSTVVMPFPGVDRETFFRQFPRYGMGFGLEGRQDSVRNMGMAIDRSQLRLRNMKENVGAFVDAVVEKWYPGALDSPEVRRFASSPDPRASIQLERMRERQKEGHPSLA